VKATKKPPEGGFHFYKIDWFTGRGMRHQNRSEKLVFELPCFQKKAD
jgi:hypothetical protein